jgi:hypothetical protein
MSISVGGKIVTDGLVIHLDALNGKSYPGSGTNWIDLTPYNNTASLNAGTNPVTIENGYATFSGVNNTEFAQIELFPEININTEYATVDMWLKIKSPNTTPNSVGLIFGWGGGSPYCVGVRPDDDTLGFISGTNDMYGIDTIVPLLNIWKHYSFVMVKTNGTGLDKTDQKLYINGQLQSLSYQIGTWGTSQFSNGSDTSLRFPGRYFTNGQNLLTNMDLALVKVYNRQLTQAEVTQNFNAHKGRFNIY